MPRFVLFDNSIISLGGHQYEYAFHLLQAADDAGLTPVMVTNKQFQDQHLLPDHWEVIPCFRSSAHEIPHWRKKQSRFDVGGIFRAKQTGHAPQKTAGFKNILSKPTRYLLWNRYNSRIKQCLANYVADVAAVYESLRLAPGDQVIFSTTMPADLEALTMLFSKRTDLARIDCHLHFHYPIYTGREVDYRRQFDRPAEMKKHFQQLSAIPHHRFHFFTTNEPLAQQFSTLNIPIEELPWQVDPQMGQSRTPHNSSRPLRIGIAGCGRDEQGAKQHAQFFNALQPEFCETQAAQFVLQAKNIESLSPQLAPHTQFFDTPAESETCASPVAVIRWPLATGDYRDLVRMTDIGLLLYDAREYYARASGILVEMLSAGIPVVVPAASWLSGEICTANWQHVDRILETIPALAHDSCGQIAWSHNHAEQLVFGPAHQPTQAGKVKVAAGATHLAIRFRWKSPQCGLFADVQVDMQNSSGATTGHWQEITGCRAAMPKSQHHASQQSQALLVPLSNATTHCVITLSNAFDDTAIELDRCECLFLDAATAPGGCPLGAVGLIAADAHMAPALTRDIIAHYDHYLRTAEQFATTYRQTHSPQNVIKILSATAQTDLHNHEHRRAA